MPHTTMPDQAKELAVNPRVAAKLLASSAASLEKDRNIGHLGIPYIKAGKRVMYLIADLREWLEAHRVWPVGNISAGDSK